LWNYPLFNAKIEHISYDISSEIIYKLEVRNQRQQHVMYMGAVRTWLAGGTVVVIPLEVCCRLNAP